MLLKISMEEKQLNFYQPLLSVRRFPPTLALEIKDEKRKTNKTIVPCVPPLPCQRSELKSGPMRHPGTVPFVWEQSPGRPKDVTKSQTRSPVLPKLPPGRQVPENVSEKQVVSSLEENATKFESTNDVTKEKESNDSEDGDEAYLDALDTLSKTESFFLNCSSSGLSGLDGLDVKPSRTFSTDDGTCDFMMGRFLPAAKAMASETPQHSSWKQPVARAEPGPMKKIVSGDKREPIYAEDKREEESDEDDDDGNDEAGTLSTKVCGLLPRLCLLNPVAGMSVRTRVPISPIRRRKARSLSVKSCHETQNELSSIALHEKRSMSGKKKTEPHESKNTVRNKSNQVPCQRNTKKLEGLSLYRRLQGSGVSPRQNEVPQSRFREQKEVLDIPEKIDEINGFTSPKRGLISFRELLADETAETETETGSASPVVEKTLYVDSVLKVVSPKLNSTNNDLGIVGKGRRVEESPLVDSLHKEIEKTKVSNPADSSVLSSCCKSEQEVGVEMLKDHDHQYHQESIVLKDSKLSDNNGGYLDSEDKQRPAKVENERNSGGKDLQHLPLPPPLPKSPTESWLWRTLPSMTNSRNSSPRSHFATRMTARHHNSSKTPC